jgi:hypothetical protein
VICDVSYLYLSSCLKLNLLGASYAKVFQSSRYPFGSWLSEIQLPNSNSGFTSQEVCEIIGRFDKVILVGDSMLRHLVGSINVIMRKDLGYGAVTDWNFNMQER